MHHSLFNRTILLVALMCFIPLLAFSGESEDILKTFNDYKASILEQKGQIAAALLTKRTIDEYQNYVNWALSANRKTLESLSFVNRFQVLLIKHRIPVETLKKLDGTSALVYAIDRDWIGKNGVIQTTLGKIDIASGRAAAEVLIGGQVAPNRFHFTKENGKWKFDLVQIMRDTDQVFQALAKQRGMTENEFIFSMVETVSGRKVEGAIWVPIQTVPSNVPAQSGQPSAPGTNRTVSPAP